MKALIFYGGWNGHEPKETAELFAGFLRGKGFEVDLEDNQDVLKDAARTAGYALIVPVWTMGKLDPEGFKNLKAAVLGGTGLAGWHGGMGDAFRENTDYQYICGGQWVAHPGNILDYEVNIVKNDPITRGIGDFTMRSEQYYMHVDPSNEVLAVTRFSGQHDPWIAGTLMPVAWKRMYGKGRVFYCSLGHVAADFQCPSAMELTGRGLLWAARAL